MKVGLQKECVMSPYLFNLFMDGVTVVVVVGEREREKERVNMYMVY